MEFAVFLRLSATTLIFLLVLSMSLASTKKAHKCLQPVQSGKCFGYVPSFAYDPQIRKCESFIYGGCGGNDNRFLSKIECENACRDI